MRIVLDTNVLVRAFVSGRGPAAEVLHRVVGTHVLLISPFLLDEVERVLARPRLRKTARFEPADVERFLNLLIDAGELVFPDSRDPAPISDPDDVAILHAAVAGRADVICTLDRHFFQPEVIAWCRKSGIRTESDVNLLPRL